MAIILFGNNTAAADCLGFLLDSGEDVAAVVADPGDEGRDGWQRSLKKAAAKEGIRVLQPENPNEPSFVDRLAKLEPEFIFSIQCRKVLKEGIINMPKRGIFNLHFSLLPRNRGCYPVAWAMIEGDKTAGATLHRLVREVDAGDIVAQKEVAIGEKATGRELFEAVSSAAVELFKETFPMLKAGKAAFTPQDDSKSTYHKMDSIDFSKNIIDWDGATGRVYDWMRAFIFPPFQYPAFNYKGDKIEIIDAEVSPLSGTRPGMVQKIEDGCIHVSTIDGAIRIRKIKIGNKEAVASELKMTAGLETGDLLGEYDG